MCGGGLKGSPLSFVLKGFSGISANTLCVKCDLSAAPPHPNRNHRPSAPVTGLSSPNGRHRTSALFLKGEPMFRTLLITMAATGLAAGAHAQDTGFYLEGGYQYLDIKPDGAGSGADTNAIAARAGVKLNSYFSIESELSTGIQDGDFDFNTDEDEFNFDDNNDGDLGDVIAASGDLGLNYLVGLYGKAELALTERLGAYARAGYAYVDLDALLETPGGLNINVEDSADGPAFGAGLQYGLTDSLYLKGDYTYYSFDNTDTSGAMLGVGWQF
jgi:opacity protein-like surface antigen